MQTSGWKDIETKNIKSEFPVSDCNAPLSKKGVSYSFYSPEEKFDWCTGRNKCQQHGGDLAMIKTAEKQLEAREYLDEIWETSACNSESV